MNDSRDSSNKEHTTEDAHKYCDILNNINEAVFIHNISDGSILDVNTAMCEMFGYQREEALGLNIGAISSGYNGYNMEGAKKLVQKAAKEGAQVFDWHAKRKDGTFFWVSVNLKHVNIAGDSCVLAVIRDITEMKEYDRERLRLIEIVETTSDLVSTSTPDEKILYLNEAGRRMLEWSHGIEKMEIKNLHPQWAGEKIKNIGLPESVKHGAWRGETAIVNATGKEIPVSQVIISHKDREGDLCYFSTIMRDISEARKQEDELRKSEKLLYTTLSSVADAVITTDTSGKITFMNPTAVKITGYAATNGHTLNLLEVFDVVDEDTEQKISDPVLEVILSGEAKKFGSHYRIKIKSGVELPISFNCAPIMDGENVLGGVLVFREISEERKREAKQRHQQKLESIGTLAGGVAHEINNPINIIMNYAELILEKLNEQDDEYDDVKNIIGESQRIASIVRNLLAFSRQETESKEPARLWDIVNTTVSLTRKIFTADQIKMDVDVSDRLPYVNCRSQQIMQVLMNLITNSRDALNEKYPKFDENKIIKIRAKEIEFDNREFVRLTVEDTGTGIEKSILDKIYDPFFTSKPRYKGTGLGLSVSHGIVEDHNGRMSVETEVGKFTRFHLDLLQ